MLNNKIQQRFSYFSVLILVLSLISGFSSWTGIDQLLQPMANTYPVLHRPMSILLTIVIQITLLWSLHRGTTTQGAGKFTVMAPGLLCFFLSIGLAYGFWFETMRGLDFAREQTEQRARGIARPVHLAQMQYQNFLDHLERAAKYSIEKSDIEKRQGGTCGDKSGPTMGPRYRMRQQDARVFKGYLPYFQKRAGELSSLSKEIEQSVAAYTNEQRPETVTFLKKSYEKISLFMQDPRISQLKSDIRERLNAHNEGTRDGKYNQTVICPDPELDTLLNPLLTQSLPVIDPARQDWFDPTSRVDSISLAYDRLAHIVSGLRHHFIDRVNDISIMAGGPALYKTAGIRFIQAPFNKKDYLPLGIAVFIDLLIFTLLLVDQRHRGVSWFTQKATATLDSRGLAAFMRLFMGHSGMENGYFRLYMMLNDRVIRSGDESYLAVPLEHGIGRSDADTRQLWVLVDKLMQSGVLKLRKTSVRKLPAKLRRIADGSGIGLFALYHLDETFLQAILDLAVTEEQYLDIENEKRPPTQPDYSDDDNTPPDFDIGDAQAA